MSVKQENRYRKLVISQNNYFSDRQRELEAMHMERKITPKTIQNKNNYASKKEIKKWMYLNIQEYDDMTLLVEGCNAELNIDQNIIYDETSWIWDLAYDTFEKFDKLD